MSEMFALLERAQEGDDEACQQVLTENSGLIWSIVKRYYGCGVETDDLYQLGCMGFLKAVEGFDTAFGTQFSTYAVPLITGEIKRFIRDDGLIKVSRTLKENGMRVKYARQRLNAGLGREPSLEEVAREAALSPEEVVLAMEADMQVESIYKSVYQNDGSELFLVDQLADHSKNGQEEILNQLLIHQLLDELKGQERRLIVLRYYQDKTQTEVAKDLGISQVQVSRLEKKILLMMRQRIVQRQDKAEQKC